jgi:hypothetical protein
LVLEMIRGYVCHFVTGLSFSVMDNVWLFSLLGQQLILKTVVALDRTCSYWVVHKLSLSTMDEWKEGGGVT